MPIPISLADFPRPLLRRVEDNFAKLRKHRPLKREALLKFKEQSRLFHTFHSNAIEGNSLTLEETRLVLEQGITIGGKPLRDHLEAANNARAFDWIWDAAVNRRTLDHVFLQELHQMVMQGTSPDAGRYRTQNVAIVGAPHAPPPPAKIVPMLDRVFRELAEPAHPIIRATFAHHRLVYVHPFSDGNGRVARLVTNLLLMNERYPRIVLAVEARRRYYAALKAADAGNYRPLAGFVLKAIDEALVWYLAAVDPESRLVPLAQLAQGTPYSQEYLSLRARQGALEAIKVGRSWQASRRALGEYVRRLRSPRHSTQRPGHGDK
jgi:Fic family protein